MIAARPIANGAFVGVVGPSGAGKDSVMRFAQDALAGDAAIHFVRRVITRPSDGVGEDHLPADQAEFDVMRAAGRFALSWDAHGNSYGTPIEIDAMIAAGAVVVANLSRTVLAELPRRYERYRVVEITASPEVLARRIAARGRETEADIANRLARKIAAEPFPETIVIDNGGLLETAGRVFVDILADLRATSALPAA